MDNELLLYDRIEVIKATNQKYDLEHNAYLSFKGNVVKFHPLLVVSDEWEEWIVEDYIDRYIIEERKL